MEADNVVQTQPQTKNPSFTDEDVISPLASGTSQINVGTNERIASALGGLVLAYWGLRGRTSWLMTLAGGALMYRGLSGNCPVNSAIGRNTAEQETKPLTITKTLTIRKPKEELYNFWRQLENLPQFMEHLEEVRQLDSRRSYWKAKVPIGVTSVEWEAEIIQDEPNQRIVWRSVPGSTVDNSGEVVFLDAPGNRGTEVRATIIYRPPAGAIGAGIAKLISPATEQMVKEDLRRFKRIMETGEIPTIAGQPSGRGTDDDPIGSGPANLKSTVGL